MASSITIGQVNICSLRNKVHDVHNLLYNQKINVLLVTETWLDSTINDSVVHIPGYDIIRQDRDFSVSNVSRGGGVLFYVQHGVSVARIQNSVLSNSCEALALKVTQFDSFSILLFVCYRRPSAPAVYWSDLEIHIEHTLQQSKLTPQHVLILGDFNVDESTACPRLSHLTSFCNSFDLISVNQLPTRFPSNSCLDLVLLPKYLPDSVTISSPTVHSLHGVSDHHLVKLSIGTNCSVRARLHLQRNGPLSEKSGEKPWQRLFSASGFPKATLTAESHEHGGFRCAAKAAFSCQQHFILCCGSCVLVPTSRPETLLLVCCAGAGNWHYNPHAPVHTRSSSVGRERTSEENFGLLTRSP